MCNLKLIIFTGTQKLGVGGVWGSSPTLPHRFAKVDLLPIASDSEKKKHKKYELFQKLLLTLLFSASRSSLPEVLCKKSILRNFAKFTEKHLCQRLFLNKVAGLRPETLLKKSLWYRSFPVNFGKFPRTPQVAASVLHVMHKINFD